MPQMYASVIIPTFNESENIGKLLIDLNQGLDSSRIKYELIIVDDDSSDDTATIVSQFSKADPRIKFISRKGKRGIGSAIFDGFLKSEGEVIVTMDADFSHPPESVIALIKAMNKYDVAVGSRYVSGGEMNGPLTRRVLSKMLNSVIVLILNLNIHDCTGGFMALKRKVFNSIDKIAGKSGDFSFEIIYKAKRAGFKITEIPFIYRWRTKGKTKTNVLKFGFEYLRSAIILRLHQ